MVFQQRPPQVRAGLMTPVVLIGGMMSGVYGPQLGEFGLSFAAGMMLHGFVPEYFRWLHLRRGEGSLAVQIMRAVARGLAIMALCYVGCLLASALAAALRFPGLDLWLQGLWAGVLIDSMLVVDDERGSRRRRVNLSAKIRDLVDSVARVHGPRVPVAVGASG